MFLGATITSSVFILFPLTLHLAAATVTNFQYSVSSCKSTVGISTDTTYASNINSLFSSLSDSLSTSSSGFASATAGSSPSTAYGLALCRGDVSTDACTACFSLAASNLRTNCSDAKEGIMWEEKCMLRYANRNISSSMEISPNDTAVNLLNTITGADSEKVLTSTLSNVTERAAAATSGGKKIATQETGLAGTNTIIYSLAQCTPDLTADDCSKCLQVAIDNLLSQNQAAIALLPSCNLRYDLYPFYDNANVPAGLPPATMPTPEPEPAPALVPVLAPTTRSTTTTTPSTPGPSVPGGKRRRSRVVEIVGILVAAAILVILGIGMWCYKRSSNSPNRYEDIAKPEIGAKSFQMDYNKVRAATKDFSDKKKLGQGGFGVVYEGKLDGKQIAVKRLTNSDSGEQFENEVALVAKLDHQNLVKLQGFCWSGKEKLLVYEYLPNSSLDKVLFEKRTSLDWRKRYNIICGIAKGLLYLHQDSQPTIVHRDLKPSNILLDKDMNPKISDFGISKKLDPDQTRANTKMVAGTDAYMAPEYKNHGEYSPKLDMYSFGIIVLEIVSGEDINRSKDRPQEGDLLTRAQRLCDDNAPLIKLVDSALENYSEEEVVKCIRIGLRCIQHHEIRPTADEVLTALEGTGNSADLLQVDCGRPPNFSGTTDTATG